MTVENFVEIGWTVFEKIEMENFMEIVWTIWKKIALQSDRNIFPNPKNAAAIL